MQESANRLLAAKDINVRWMPGKTQVGNEA